MTGFPTGDVWACEWRRYTSVVVTGHERPIWLSIPLLLDVRSAGWVVTLLSFSRILAVR